MKQSELVEKTKIGKSSISTYISGAYEPKQKNIYKIAKALDVSEAWLMGMDVSMERINLDTTTYSLSKEETSLLKNFNQLNDLGKKEANKRVSELVEIQRYRFNDEQVATKFVAEKTSEYNVKEHVMPIAAHAKEGNFTKEELQHDLDIMNDDSFWE